MPPNNRFLAQIAKVRLNLAWDGIDFSKGMLQKYSHTSLDSKQRAIQAFKQSRSNHRQEAVGQRKRYGVSTT